MDAKRYDMGNIDIAWCPGCGDYGILKVLKQALDELDISPENLMMVSGIGQAAKIPHYLKCHVFNGLHGRALPAAVAIKASNRSLTVIAESGDGDMYGEGGNHFIHTIRRNPNITNIVHNNMVYGLTKGQASPTSQKGFVTPVQVSGVILEPFNPLAVAIALDASFVARAFIGDMQQTKELMKKAITHKGYALLDIFQPCVSFNKINSHQWFKDNTYYLEESHDIHNRNAAFAKACETEKLPLGMFYINEQKKPFEENLSAYESLDKPLYERQPDLNKLQELIGTF
ncbi:MAG: thiamine pyrophosphate-dependent enzyme [Phycisphaerae bacterium]|nr:thiamine pyrophosphate-dependent enzyme [Phycisphaerae bacterium]